MAQLQKIDRLLVVVDPSVERDFVVDKAKHIARMANASVHFFLNNSNTLSEHSFIYEGIDEGFFETQRRLYQEHYQDMLDALVEEFQADNIEAKSTFSQHHNLAESIIDATVSEQPDIVLKSTHHHAAIERALITNTDWRLIRKCPTALMLVKPEPWNSDGSVVTGVDPLHSKAEQSRLDHILLRGTELLGKTLQLRPCVFHSYYPFVSTLFPLGGESVEHLERIRSHHVDKMNELLKGYDFDEADIHLTEGDLIPTLIGYLDSVNANLLVIGALSRNAIERAIVGDTAEKILEDCPCDVLVLKT